MNKGALNTFSSNSAALPAIRGVAYLIVTESKKIVYSSPLCQRKHSLHEGNQIEWAFGENKRHGYIIVKDPKSLNETHLVISTVFDLIWHGESAKMILLDSSKFQAEAIGESTVLQEENNFSGITPWMAFRCKLDESIEMSSVNDQAFTLTGYTADELINGPKTYRSLMSQIDRELIYKIIQKSVSSFQPYNILYRIQQGNGDYKWVEEHGQMVDSESDKTQYLEGWIVDVTDRKRIEDALWESESRYRSLVEASPDAVLLLDKDGCIVLENKHFCDLIGIEDPGLILGKKVTDFFETKEPLAGSTNYPSCWKEKPSEGQIFTLKGADGSLIPIETNFSTIIGNNGEIEACIAVGRDIRQRNQAEKALRESEARYRAIVENNPEMIVRFDRYGRVSFANTAFLNFVSISAEDLYGKNLAECIKTEGHSDVSRLLRLVSPEMEPLENEFCMHLSGKAERWYRWRTSAIKDDNEDFLEYQSMGEDISDRKKASLVEKESENRLRQLMENIKLLAIILGLDGQITFCNLYFCELTGWKKEDVLNRDWFSQFIPIDIAHTLKQELMGNVLEDQFPIHHENPILTKNGERRIIAWTNTLMRDSLGNPLGIASIGEDITEKHEAERIQDAILKISQAANQADNLDHLYSSIHAILKTLTPVDNFFIAFYDKEKDLISFPYFVDQFDAPPEPKKPSKGLTEYVLKTGQTLLVNPEKLESMLARDEIVSFGAPSLDWIGVPLKVENEIFGVMVAQTYSPGIRYQEKDEKILSFVSNQVAMAIDRKRREQALLTSQKRNQLLIEASTDAIIIRSLDGSILDCNDIGLRMFGYTHDEIIKMNISALVSPEFFNRHKKYTEWELEQVGTIHDVMNVRKDGSIFPVEVSIRQTSIDDNPVVVAYVRDVTEQKKSAQVIIENEEKFRTLSETTTAGIFIYRGDRYIYVNPMWCQMTGFSAEELLHMKPLDIFSPEDNSKAVGHIEQAINGETGRARLEHTLVTRSGEICIIDLNITRTVFDGQTAVIGTAVDITNRKQREHELEVIAEMSETLRIDVSRDQVLDTAMTKLMEIMKLDGAFFSLFDSNKKLIEIKKTSGVWEKVEPTSFSRDQGLSGHILSTSLPYLNSQPKTDPYILHPDLIQNFSSLAGVPLIAKGETIGSLVIGSRQHFSENDLRLLKAIGDLTASAIHRADLFEQTVQQTEELRHAYDSTLEGWALALELRDKETQGHSVRIAKMTIKLAKRLGIPEEELENIRRGALLHDIGKLGVPDTVLLKNGTLTPDEWAIMQKHPTYAYEMLSQIKDFKGAIDIPYCHHEWWDGSGYPRGLEGKNIPLPARIFCIVDVWDALTSDRPYREAWSKKETLAHIINQAGTHFDPDIVNAFIQMIVEEK